MTDKKEKNIARSPLSTYAAMAFSANIDYGIVEDYCGYNKSLELQNAIIELQDIITTIVQMPEDMPIGHESFVQGCAAFYRAINVHGLVVSKLEAVLMTVEKRLFEHRLTKDFSSDALNNLVKARDTMQAIVNTVYPYTLEQINKVIMAYSLTVKFKEYMQNPDVKLHTTKRNDLGFYQGYHDEDTLLWEKYRQSVRA